MDINYLQELDNFYASATHIDMDVPNGILDVDTNSVEIAFLILSKYISKERAESLRASIFFNNCHKVIILNKSKLGILLYCGAKLVSTMKGIANNNKEEKE